MQEQDKVKFLERMEPVLKELDAKLGKQQYVIGDYLTYNDFVLFEVNVLSYSKFAIFPEKPGFTPVVRRNI